MALESSPPGLMRSIALLSAAAFASSATIRVSDPLLPQLAVEFATSPGAVAIVSTAATLAYGLCQLLFGPLGDRFGKYRVIALATLASAVATSASALATDVAMLAAFRLLGGAAAAAIIPLSMAYIGDAIPYERRQPVLARFLSGQILGLIFGQAAGGAFAEFIGWRGVFLVLGAIYLIVALLLWAELRSPRVATTPPTALDFRRLPGRFLSILQRPKARSVLPTVFCEGFAFFGALTFLGVFAHLEFGLSYLAIGLILGCFGVGGIAYAASAGAIIRALGERRMALTGGLIMAVCLMIFALAPVWQVLPPTVALIGLGFYMMHNTLQTNATQIAPEARGMAVATFASVFFIGQALGVAAVGAVVDQIGYRPVFVVAGVAMTLLATLFARALPGRAPAPPPTSPA